MTQSLSSDITPASSETASAKKAWTKPEVIDLDQDGSDILGGLGPNIEVGDGSTS
ncbi:MAG: hypothetical protein AAGK02_16015 [Pseudomonadota bacterium]